MALWDVVLCTDDLGELSSHADRPVAGETPEEAARAYLEFVTEHNPVFGLQVDEALVTPAGGGGTVQISRTRFEPTAALPVP